MYLGIGMAPLVLLLLLELSLSFTIPFHPSTQRGSLHQHETTTTTRLFSSTSTSTTTSNDVIKKGTIVPLGKVQDLDDEMTFDVIVIGSGLAGLSCAALLSFCNKSVAVLESHDAVGGCAHGWTRQGFHFESGPSLYSGLSAQASPNPLKNIFQIIEEEPNWITYDRWGTVLPDGSKFAPTLGNVDEFLQVLRQHAGKKESSGEEAVKQWNTLAERLKPLSDAAQSLTSLALREDAGAVFTLGRYPFALFKTLQQGQALGEPFGNILQELQIPKNSFVKHWLDMLCFLLQGLPSSGTMNAVLSFMFADWYRPNVVLDFPQGGSGEIANALVRGIQKFGSNNNVYCNSHVESILVENNRAVGIQLKNNNKKIYAREAVVSNADPYRTNDMLKMAQTEGKLQNDICQYMNQLVNTDTEEGGIPDLKSFIHIHAGINATGLPTEASADFPAQWAVIRHWGDNDDDDSGVESPRNIVLCSMPSLLDPSLAPSGMHVLHAYVPATEPYEDWQHLERSSDEYKAKKDVAADFLWNAIEEYVPNARDRAIPGTVQIGTPKTHERFLRRTRGSYGARAEAGVHSLPGHVTPLEGLHLCGDYTYPGIGVPATATSGAITANNLVSIRQHWNMLDKIDLGQYK